jgi:hypothetical protein
LRQVAQLRTNGFDGLLDAGDLMGPEIIHHQERCRIWL